MNDPIAATWRAAGRLVLGLSIGLVMVAAAIAEATGHGHPGWMLPAAGWGVGLGFVLLVESGRASARRAR